MTTSQDGDRRRAGGRTVKAIAGALATILGSWAMAADVDGSRDHPLVARAPGATITAFTVRERAVAAFPLDDARLVHAEGRFTLVRYRHPAGTRCDQVVAAHAAALRAGGVRAFVGTRLPPEVDRGGDPEPDVWASRVARSGDGGTSYVLVTCTAGGLAPSGSVVVVESSPPATRGRAAPRPAFDTAPAIAEVRSPPARDARELAVPCPRSVKVDLGPVSPVDTGSRADDVASDGSAWVARFEPATVSRVLTFADAGVVDGRLACSYAGDAATPTVTLTRALGAEWTCTRGPREGFNCTRR